MTIPIPFNRDESNCPACQRKFNNHHNLKRHRIRDCIRPSPQLQIKFACRYCHLTSSDKKVITTHQNTTTLCKRQLPPKTNANLNKATLTSKPYNLHIPTLVNNSSTIDRPPSIPTIRKLMENQHPVPTSNKRPRESDDPPTAPPQKMIARPSTSSAETATLPPTPLLSLDLTRQIPRPLWKTRLDKCQDPVSLEKLANELSEEIKKTKFPNTRRQKPNWQESTGNERPNDQAPTNDTHAPRPQKETRQPWTNKPRPAPSFDPKASSRIQRLYRDNKKRAMREVLEQNSPFCDIDKEIIAAHFHQAPTPAVADLPEPPPPTSANDPLKDPFTPEEVAKKLGNFSNTAPGPDGITYGDLKKFDPEGTILSALFNAVNRIQAVPSSWNLSRTILIHKKGDRNLLSNWRPIALGNTMCKLYAACIAKRLASWSQENNRMGTHQKGFMHFEGCLEHNFLLQSAIQDARRSRKDILIAWLDLSDAFGSIPHEVIWQTLQWHGLAHSAIKTIKRLYREAQTTFLTQTGTTDPIPIQKGVKQGCPLSPIVFNLTIEPFLADLAQSPNGYDLHGRPLNLLAYADDIALIAKSPEDMESALQKLANFASSAGLKFNASKCASLHVRGKTHSTVPSQFHIQGEPMPHLTEIDMYKHLGVPTGFSLQPSHEATIERMMTDANLIDISLLAPWQKIDAINTFITPRLSFALRTDYVAKSSLDKMDTLLKKLTKKWLYLPSQASTEPIHLPYKEGGTNILPLNTHADISLVVHAVHLLTSKDPSIPTTAMEDLRRVVKKRIGTQPDNQEILDYLNGRMDGAFATSTDIRNTWSRLRTATSRLTPTINLHWRFHEGLPKAMLGETPVERKNGEHLMRRANTTVLKENLFQKKDQGKVYTVSTQSHISNHYMQTGKYFRFADWRFIHKARLGVVPLNGCRRFGTGDRRCRRCGYTQETLPHVLNHCMRGSKAIQLRHDAVLHRLANAVNHSKASEIRVNRVIPDSNSNLRPDLMVRWEKEKRIAIADVAIPFENGPEAFTVARMAKESKYAEIKRELELLGYSVTVDAFLVGALGSYDSSNLACLRHLCISGAYSPLMSRLMVSDAIRWSRDIYTEHVTGKRQYPDSLKLPPPNEKIPVSPTPEADDSSNPTVNQPNDDANHTPDAETAEADVTNDAHEAEMPIEPDVPQERPTLRQRILNQTLNIATEVNTVADSETDTPEADEPQQNQTTVKQTINHATGSASEAGKPEADDHQQTPLRKETLMEKSQHPSTDDTNEHSIEYCQSC